MVSADPHARCILGIDTGGTYTDAVVYDPARHAVIAEAKAPTTHHDLSIGILGAIDRILTGRASGPPTTPSRAAVPDIDLICLSTTLATNAVVEDRGHAVAAVLIGFDHGIVGRGGLDQALRGDPVLHLGGGHDPHGAENAPLELDHLRRALDDGWAAEARAMAIVGHFAVRNPEHERRVAEAIVAARRIPVSLGHELSARLDATRRAVTAVLNARLVPIIDDLLDRTGVALAARGIDAPIMVVRGDGSLVSADYVRDRPIETVLSGPAASAIGAAHLAGRRSAVVVDIGGTTTDIAVLDDGFPQLDDDGATVGEHRTMVRAVAMSTIGIGGDSHVVVDEDSFDGRLLIGPRRVDPLAVAAQLAPEAFRRALSEVARADAPRPETLTFAYVPTDHVAGPTGALHQRDRLDPADEELIDRLTGRAVSLGEFGRDRTMRARLERLVRLRRVRLAGVTPTDAAHVLDAQHTADARAAHLGLGAAARWRDRRGRPVAGGAEELAAAILTRVEEVTAAEVLRTALRSDGVDPAIVPAELVRLAFARTTAVSTIGLGIQPPFVGVGAAAHLVHPGAARRLGTEIVVPAQAAVANAVGAAVAQVRAVATVMVTSPQRGVYIVHDGESPARSTDVDEARALATASARRRAHADVDRIGADDVVTEERWDETVATVEGVPLFVEGRVTVRATGRPRRAPTATSRPAPDRPVPSRPDDPDR